MTPLPEAPAEPHASSLDGSGAEPADLTDRSPTAGRTDGGDRRRWLRRAGALVVTAAVVAAGVLLTTGGLLDREEPAVDPLRDTASVAVASLVATYEAEGLIVYDTRLEIGSVGDGGVITRIVEREATVESGDVLWRVVDEPVLALEGEVPASRALAAGDEGVDVLQLEASLVALGYDPDGAVTVDETFTANTAAMVERWQDDVGAEVTGFVDDGAVVFLPGPVRVGDTGVDVGDTVADGDVVIAVTALERVVELTVPVADAATLEVGHTASLRLPDRSTAEAVVVETVEGADGDVEIRAELLGEVDLEVDIVPVTITWTAPLADDVLTVPANALIRTDDGSYGVEVRRPSGVEELVPVEVGRSAGSTV
ncbi:MAG: peptidoglycan-binding domain-containing protein, partial [Actinomycetota bacterium]